MKPGHILCIAVAHFSFLAPALAQSRNEAPKLDQTLRVENITIHFARSNVDDAKEVAAFLPSAIKQLQDHFKPAGLDEHVTGFRCDLYLHPAPTERASESTAASTTGTRDGTNRTYFAEMHLLTPSAHSTEARTHIGEPKDDAYFERLLVHEYAAPVLDRITRAKPAGWRYYDAPRWFVEGYEEYVALTCSNEHSRNVTMRKYKQIVSTEPKRVRDDFGLVVRDNYLDGSMIVAFMHDRFGAEKTQALLSSQAESFGEAVAKTLDVNLESFVAAWKEWLAEIKTP